MVLQLKKQAKKFLSTVSVLQRWVSWAPTAKEANLSEEIFWTNLPFAEKLEKPLSASQGEPKGVFLIFYHGFLQKSRS